MYTEKQLIKFGLYAERAHRLAFDVALAAAELGQYGRGMAIVADEMRSIGNQLYRLFEKETISEEGILNAAKQLKFLAINGSLEMMRLHESQLILKKRIAVILDEIRRTSIDIESAFGIKQELPLVIPRIIEKNTVINESSLFNSYYVLFSVSDISFCEAAENIREVFISSAKDNTKNSSIIIRGEELHVLNYCEKLSLAQKPCDQEVYLRISTEYEDEPKQYAVLIDGLPEIIYSEIGKHASPLKVPANLVRECWNCEENMQMIFLDYGEFNKG